MMIGPGGLLLVVSRLFAVIVLTKRACEKSHTEHRWRFSKSQHGVFQ